MTAVARRGGVAVLLGALPLGGTGGDLAAHAQPKEFRAGGALSPSGIFSRGAALLEEVYGFRVETGSRGDRLTRPGGSPAPRCARPPGPRA